MGIFKSKKTIFSREIRPACMYCRFGRSVAGTEDVSCPRKGVVAQDYSCRRFEYDATKRVPMKKAALPEFKDEDFTL